ncbi:hypothetical protein BDB00DRAFT_861829 [Zychaea mexicana]|uniref:uncharacterized protein n=1 Tax=Zychaea mexicana TaxID=64656 RepID=UPI0022FE67A9|nr:uncharacterized protein BDB00DRAFT_861829 [Zychaea mexicana]KAI9471783.1 hypothetical protein BDB00DRAFT_861829 [Zychaea mexicana]
MLLWFLFLVFPPFWHASDALDSAPSRHGVVAYIEYSSYSIQLYANIQAHAPLYVLLPLVTSRSKKMTSTVSKLQCVWQTYIAESKNYISLSQRLHFQTQTTISYSNGERSMTRNGERSMRAIANDLWRDMANDLWQQWVDDF